MKVDEKERMQGIERENEGMKGRKMKGKQERKRKKSAER